METAGRQIAAGGVVCFGEALALVSDLDAVDDPAAPASAAGAEVNVALDLAAAGVPVAWIGRVGDDPHGALVARTLAGAGVDTTGIETDPARPTGRYAKAAVPGPDGPRTGMHYRRTGSAASATGPDLLGRPRARELLTEAGWVHVGGITAAVSPSCAATLAALLARPRTYRVSFDVNWREQMWPDGDPAAVVALAGLADVVLVGADEAVRVFGTGDPAGIRALLPGPELIVVKDGADRAVAVHTDGTATSRSALAVDVVEPVGAGDAFAAGLLTGLVRGDDVARCLRRGHLGAAAVLVVPGDSAPPLPDHLLDLDAGAWAALRVGPGGLVKGVAV
ncbi:sugar kinase [Pseudonocardia parietis]|uniref:2-dehydro-3-deoxygluconokinase n=1 Tax=Pseudonocardia parietis TaxID=570936 RepID=A0ABS4W453_9PSEU|nr:sugar kinase [Pseudonocardia parietis]MBP2370956.1 2-dehydro-3-deoxygluconokinase [Pseudonocardia parietis]